MITTESVIILEPISLYQKTVNHGWRTWQTNWLTDWNTRME